MSTLTVSREQSTSICPSPWGFAMLQTHLLWKDQCQSHLSITDKPIDSSRHTGSADVHLIGVSLTVTCQCPASRSLSSLPLPYLGAHIPSSSSISKQATSMLSLPTRIHAGIQLISTPMHSVYIILPVSFISRIKKSPISSESLPLSSPGESLPLSEDAAFNFASSSSKSPSSLLSNNSFLYSTRVTFALLQASSTAVTMLCMHSTGAPTPPRLCIRDLFA
ncbi:hypothetical protein V8C42DRAFT_297694 [Trichoderma barbatum]